MVFKVNDKGSTQLTFTCSNSTVENTRKKCKMCSKLTLKHQNQCSVVFIVNFEHISHFFSISFVDFEQANVKDYSTQSVLQYIHWLKVSNGKTKVIWKSTQSSESRHQNDVINIVLVSILLN